jgi:hypothetical protein
VARKTMRSFSSVCVELQERRSTCSASHNAVMRRRSASADREPAVQRDGDGNRAVPAVGHFRAICDNPVFVGTLNAEALDARS